MFDIELLIDMSDEERAFAILRFHRRHVYEHLGGEADEKYILESKDQVRMKQALRETQESAHRTASLVVKLGKNLHKGFHDIFPPLQGPIQLYAHRNRAAQ